MSELQTIDGASHTGRWARVRPWIVPTFGSAGWKGRLRGFALRVVFYYALICLGMGLFQRELIYRPSRAEAIRAADSTLPAGYVHDVQVETEDGVRLNGWHVLPAGLKLVYPAGLIAARTMTP